MTCGCTTGTCGICVNRHMTFKEIREKITEINKRLPTETQLNDLKKTFEEIESVEEK